MGVSIGFWGVGGLGGLTGWGQAWTTSTGTVTCSKGQAWGAPNWGVAEAKMPRDTTRTTKLWGICICMFAESLLPRVWVS